MHFIKLFTSGKLYLLNFGLFIQTHILSLEYANLHLIKHNK